MIELKQVRKSYDEGETFAVQELDLHVEEGELLVILGESGCGKTTTRKMINRLIEPSSGDILVGGELTRDMDPVELRRRIGYVFQAVGLFPHMTVGENVGIVPELLGWDNARKNARTDELLDLVGLEPGDYHDRAPAQLSGGQRQRVGLARALAAKPKLMLMDEPFGALDPLTRDNLQDEFRRIHEEQGLTTVMVTHDITEALLMADRIAVMNAGQILHLGTPHQVAAEPPEGYVEKLMAMPKRLTERLERVLEEGGK